MTGILYILADFGGPRNLEEIPSFMHELLLDPEVIRPKLPKPLHYLLFSRIAKKRAKKTAKEYIKLGGKSPIYFYTEEMAKRITHELNSEVLAFHRYLPKTHAEFIKNVEDFPGEIRVIPLFPQFTYAVTGGMARFFAKRLTKKLNQIRWIKSYPSHPAFIQSYRENIREFLKTNRIREEEVFFVFSCHGIPISYVEEGDPYEKECNSSFSNLLAEFPLAKGILSYQSRFGPEEWLKPYTEDVCTNIVNFAQGRKKIVIIPLSFISDHIETLYEIEDLYLPLIRNGGLEAFRCPALNFHASWVQGLLTLLKEENWVNCSTLLNKKTPYFSTLKLSIRRNQ